MRYTIVGYAPAAEGRYRTHYIAMRDGWFFVLSRAEALAGTNPSDSRGRVVPENYRGGLRSHLEALVYEPTIELDGRRTGYIDLIDLVTAFRETKSRALKTKHWGGVWVIIDNLHTGERLPVPRSPDWIRRYREIAKADPPRSRKS